MPQLTGYRERLHQPLWDTVVHPPLPCDAWLVSNPSSSPSRPFAGALVITSSDVGMLSAPARIAARLEETVIWPVIPHGVTIRPLEVKHASPDDMDVVLSDFWRQLLDLHDFGTGAVRSEG